MIESSTSSPHTRGWSRVSVQGHIDPPVFPAYAGVVPPPTTSPRAQPRLPRIRGGGPDLTRDDVQTLVSSPHTRGGGPYGAASGARMFMSSPHTRGWSPPGHRYRGVVGVFPAYAGVVPVLGRGRFARRCLPRIRGGGPCAVRRGGPVVVSSPHTRGWSREKRSDCSQCLVFPAYAGVVPSSLSVSRPTRCLPRIRGVVPTPSPRPGTP